MSKPKWTPGPWKAFQDDAGIDVIGKDGTHIANECQTFEDARLIAAAPEMAEALEAALPTLRWYHANASGAHDKRGCPGIDNCQGESAKLVKQVEAALRKARGEER